jgi:thymidylate kinase
MQPTRSHRDRPRSNDDLLDAALGGLDAAGIPWALAGGRDAPRPEARDVDVVVAPRDLRAADRVLASYGFARRRVRGPNRVYLGYDAELDRWRTLDVASRFRVGPCVIDGETVLARRRRPGAYWTLDADDAFWLRMLGALAAGGVQPSDREELRVLAAGAGPSSRLALLATFWCPPGWSAARIRAAAESGDWPALDEACRDCATKATSLAAGAADRVRRTWTRGCRRAARFVPRRGLAVAVIGPDGAGKSTLAASLVECFGLPGRVFYMGLHAPVGDRGGHVAPLRRKPLPVRMKRQTRRLLRLALTAARAELTLARGQLAVFDRYTYDADVHWAGKPGTRVRRWLVRHAAPKPDLTIVLDVPGEVMFARKGEHSPALLASRRRRYLELARSSAGFAVIDATQPAHEVLREACALAWSTFTPAAGQRHSARPGAPAHARASGRMPAAP